MFSKNNDKGKIIIEQLRYRQNSNGKGYKRQEIQKHQYQTDLKRQLGQLDKSKGPDTDQKDQAHCSNCRAIISQFVTKKPTHLIQKVTQTAHKPFLVDLIEEKVESICHKNARLGKAIQQKEDELFQKEQEIGQIQDKFTSILLVLAQQVANTRKSREEYYELKKTMEEDSDTPAYLKALQFDC